MGRRLISQRDFAKLLGVTQPRAWQIVHRNQVKSEVVAGHVLVDQADAERYARRRQAKRQATADRKAALTHATA